MQKVARKSSADPAQEQLRKKKETWNRKVSEFINDVIHFKKLMNGAPNNFFKEKSKITNPIPADPVTIIGSLVSDFQALSSESNDIIREQLDYSKNRKQPHAPGSEHSSLSNQFASIDRQYYLMSTASNSLSRFFTYLLNPAIGSSEKARIRKYRMSLLSACVTMNKDLKKMEENIVGSGPQSIFDASKVLDKIEDNWSFILTGVQAYQTANIEQKPKDTGTIKDVTEESVDEPVEPDDTEAEPTQSKDDRIENVILDFQQNADNFLDLDYSAFWKVLVKFRDEKTKTKDKEKIKPEILSQYYKLIDKAKKQYGVEGNNLAEIWKNKTAAGKTPQLEAVAKNISDKWFGKLRHQISPFDKTSAIRLDICTLSEKCRASLDAAMNSLQNGMNTEELTNILSPINSYVLNIRVMMKALSGATNGKNFNNSFLNMLEQGDLDDYKTSLDPKQKEKLEKMITQKQLQNLNKRYLR